MSQSAFVGVIDLLRIMPTEAQSSQLVIANVSDQFQELGIFAEKRLPDVSAAFDGKALTLTVHNLAHPPHQESGFVARDQCVPFTPPDHFEAVPTSATKSCS